MNFLPEKVARTRSYSNGTSITEIFSIDTWANLGMFEIIFFLFFIALFFPIISFFILMGYIIDMEYNKSEFNVYGILLSVYLIIDTKKEWILNIIHSNFFDKDEIKLMVDANGAVILTHLTLLIFGDAIFLLAAKSRLIAFVYIAIGTFFYYLLSGFIFSHLIKVY